MCGIAGRILAEPGRIGHDLVELMDAQAHRGADSTGFALYGPSLESEYVVRAVGFDRSRLGRDLDGSITIVRDFGSDIVEDPTYDDARSRHVSVRFEVREIDDVASWSEDRSKSSRIPEPRKTWPGNTVYGSFSEPTAWATHGSQRNPLSCRPPAILSGCARSPMWPLSIMARYILIQKPENNHTPGAACWTGRAVGVVTSFAQLRLPSEAIRPGVRAKSFTSNLLDPVFHDLGRGEDLVGKIALLEELEHGLDRVQFRTVRRQAQQRHVVRYLKALRTVPSLSHGALFGRNHRAGP